MREISGEDDNLVEHVDRIRKAHDNNLNEQDAESQDELEDPGDPELEDTGDVDPESAKEPGVQDVPIDDLMDPGDPDLDDQAAAGAASDDDAAGATSDDDIGVGVWGLLRG